MGNTVGNTALSTRGVRRGLVVVESPAVWRLGTFYGRLAELSGGPATAVLTFAFKLVHEAQRLGEPVAWITALSSSFFPPDVARAGVDLDALVVIRVPRPNDMPKAADQLVRSGGFGLVVLDLGTNSDVPISIQTRLSGLAKKHHAALLCLTEKSRDNPSLGSLVSLRAEATRSAHPGGRLGGHPGAGAEMTADRYPDRYHDRYHLEVEVLKDKRRGVGWRHQEVMRGPPGIR